MRPVYFSSVRQFHQWLESHGATRSELLVGFFKKSSGKQELTYRQALDEALCFGWIDGVRRSVDALRYLIRFSPRKPKSIWSRINTRRAEELKQLGLMQPVGLKAFAARSSAKTGIYSFENRPRKLLPRYENEFRANTAAWAFFQARPPWYRRTASWWVLSAKQEETRRRRLGILIRDSAAGRTIGPLTRSATSKTDGKKSARHFLRRVKPVREPD